MIKQQLELVKKHIEAACVQAERPSDSVTLVAVSKRHGADKINTAYQLGQRDFGENYLNEALDKQTQLTNLAIIWHYIGSIQSNKTKKIAEHFSWVHTVDSLRIATRLSEQRSKHLPALNICLQINIDDEASKSGLPADKTILTNLAKEIQILPNIHLRGLMCIPAPKLDKMQEQTTFAQMQQLQNELNQELGDNVLDTLSMGMSDDLDTAIGCGATIVRVGTAIFGERSQ